MERKRFDIVAVVKQAISDSQAVFEGEGLTLRSTLPAQAIIVDADSVRFAQVVNNLLHNTSKFTECGGEVHVSVEREGKQALVRVADTGVGLAPDQLTRIFDMFAQVEESPGMRVAGLGIGLSLAKSIVDMQGGSITAQSEGRGKGSVFSVWRQALEAGFDTHMTKPVDLHELEQLFSSKQLKRQAQSGKPDQTRKAV